MRPLEMTNGGCGNTTPPFNTTLELNLTTQKSIFTLNVTP